MPYKIVNVSLEHQHAMKRRTASRMHMEPLVAGQRLRLRASRELTDEQYENNKPWLDEYEKHGVITVEQIGVKAEEKKTEKESEVPIQTEKEMEVPVQKETPVQEALPPSQNTELASPPPAPGTYPNRRDDKKRGR